MIKGKVDNFLINETKLQFAMSGYRFIRIDRNKFTGGIASYITDRLASRTIKVENLSDIEILTLEITIRKNKIIVARIYKPPKLSETDLTTNLETIISKL